MMPEVLLGYWKKRRWLKKRETFEKESAIVTSMNDHRIHLPHVRQKRLEKIDF